MVRRAFGLVAAAVTVAVVATAPPACIIAEPPDDPPRLPPTRPTIVRASVVPPPSAVLGRWPSFGTFIVPVELYDPTVSFQWSAFVDYNPATGEGLSSSGTSDFEPSSNEGRVRTLYVTIPTPSPDRCHVVEIVVALRFPGDLTAALLHSPAEPGGDIVSWFYNPAGDLSGCPTLDAGIDASPAPDDDDGGPR